LPRAPPRPIFRLFRARAAPESNCASVAGGRLRLTRRRGGDVGANRPDSWDFARFPRTSRPLGVGFSRSNVARMSWASLAKPCRRLRFRGRVERRRMPRPPLVMQGSHARVARHQTVFREFQRDGERVCGSPSKRKDEGIPPRRFSVGVDFSTIHMRAAPRPRRFSASLEVRAKARRKSPQCPTR
jgi:hypothetical protein